MTKENKDNSIKKLIEILKAWDGEKPDLDNTDFSNFFQTEKSYQEQQKKWLESVKKKKNRKRKPD